MAHLLAYCLGCMSDQAQSTIIIEPTTFPSKVVDRTLFSVYIATFEIFSSIDNFKMQNILGSSKTDGSPCLGKDDRLNLLEPVDFQFER